MGRGKRDWKLSPLHIDFALNVPRDSANDPPYIGRLFCEALQEPDRNLIVEFTPEQCIQYGAKLIAIGQRLQANGKDGAPFWRQERL